MSKMLTYTTLFCSLYTLTRRVPFYFYLDKKIIVYIIGDYSDKFKQ